LENEEGTCVLKGLEIKQKTKKEYYMCSRRRLFLLAHWTWNWGRS